MTAYQWATVLAVACLLALMVWRPVVEMVMTDAGATDPPPAAGEDTCRHDLTHTYPTGATQCLRCDEWVADDQGYVF